MLSLVLGELLAVKDFPRKKALHVAPESCMKKLLVSSFDNYETLDLFMDHVDHKEDLQNMSLDDSIFDCVIVSRVLAAPPDLNACLSEIHRILKPRGVVIISEPLLHKKTIDRIDKRDSRARELGLDFIEVLKTQFQRVELFLSDRYDAKHQLNNIIDTDPQNAIDYPELVDIPGMGYKEIVLVCST